MAVYYNEIDPFAAEWLRALMRQGLIPDGEVDTRSIVDVRPSDLAGSAQCHFFAGIAGWSHALRLAGWADDRPIWTGSCPCQPFSVAGKGKGTADERHLWPVFFNLIRECRPPVVMGEQVAGSAGYGWFDGVAADLETEGYASRAVDIPACAVDAPHIRQRLYWVSAQNVDDTKTFGRQSFTGERPSRLRAEGTSAPECRGEFGDRDGGVLRSASDMVDAARQSESPVGRVPNGTQSKPSGAGHRRFWDDAEWIVGADGKARRAQPDIRLLADGVPNRVGRLRAYGNAVVPPLAEEVIGALMEVL